MPFNVSVSKPTSRLIALLSLLLSYGLVLLPPLFPTVDTSSGVYKQADDPGVLFAHRTIWFSLSAAYSLILVSLILFIKSFSSSHMAFNVGYSLALAMALLLASCATVAVDYGGLSGQPTVTLEFLKNFPLTEWSFCNTPYTSFGGQSPSQYSRGKVMWNLNYNYAGGFLIRAIADRQLAFDQTPVEVLHLRDPSAFSAGQAWFYVARGSGIFATFQKIATYATHVEFVKAYGLKCQNYQCSETITQAFEKAAANGYDAVQFTSHMDQMCGNTLPELVAISPHVDGSKSCPIPFWDNADAASKALNSTACKCTETIDSSNCGSPTNRAARRTPGSEGEFVFVGLALLWGGWLLLKKLWQQTSSKTPNYDSYEMVSMF